MQAAILTAIRVARQAQGPAVALAELAEAPDASHQQRLLNWGCDSVAG